MNICYDNTKRVARVDVHDFLSRHASMSFGPLSSNTTPITPAICVETKAGVSLNALKAANPVAVIFWQSYLYTSSQT